MKRRIKLALATSVALSLFIIIISRMVAHILFDFSEFNYQGTINTLYLISMIMFVPMGIGALMFMRVSKITTKKSSIISGIITTFLANPVAGIMMFFLKDKDFLE